MLSNLVFREEGTTCVIHNFQCRHILILGDNVQKKLDESSFRRQFLIAPQHSDNIVFISRDQVKSAEKLVFCDGIFADAPNVELIMLSADCFPIIFTTEDQKFISLVHAGWRGTTKEIAHQAIEKAVKNYEVEPAQIIVGIGPGIQKCCFGNEDQAQKLIKENLSWIQHIHYTKHDAKHSGTNIDMLDFNYTQLLKSGIKPKNIYYTRLCTCCAKNEKGAFIFPSHQRSRINGGPEGRFATVVTLS